MALFTKKPVTIEAITFQEFVEYAKANSTEPHWNFDYKGHPITHENDECYLIPTLEGTHRFTPDDMLITGVKGEIYPCKTDIFKLTYDEGSTDISHRFTQIEKGNPEPNSRVLAAMEDGSVELADYTANGYNGKDSNEPYMCWFSVTTSNNLNIRGRKVLGWKYLDKNPYITTQ